MTEHDKYRYTESGLDNVYLVNGFKRIVTQRGEVVQIQDEKGLLAAIGLQLVTEKKWLIGKEVKFLRKELGLTQNDLAAILGMDIQAFARWEKGKRSREASAADRLLRVLYFEHIKGNPRIKECLQKLAELDELMDDVDSRPIVFAKPTDGARREWVREAEAFYA